MSAGRAMVRCLMAVLVASCGPIAPTPSNGLLPGDFDIHVANGTTLDVSIVVNGALVLVVPPGGQTIPADRLPALPWAVEARTASGRVLTSVDIRQDSVQRRGNGTHSAGARADLSCGRLDIYVAIPLMGPMPGPGVPGDCDP